MRKNTPGLTQAYNTKVSMGPMQLGESSMAAETAVNALFSADFQDWVVYNEPIAIEAPEPIDI